jgi:hypothetical protein
VIAGAGGTLLNTCGGGGIGVLPTTGIGTCSTSFVVTAGSALQPGPATYVLHLYRSPAGGTQVQYDSAVVNVTLVAPTPTIESVTLPSSYYVLGSGFATYTAALGNPVASAWSGIILQAYISQGTAWRAAGGTLIQCSGQSAGVLPVGGCSSAADIVAGNAPASGNGTLVYGPATLEIQLKDGTTIYDTKTFPITLVAPTPSIVSISLESTTFAIDGTAVGYTAVVYNPTTSSLSTVVLQATIEAGFAEGAAVRSANGTQVTCGASAGVLPPGSCTFDFTAAASNFAAGSGTLQAGPATLKFELKQNGTVIDTKTIAITLTS